MCPPAASLQVFLEGMSHSMTLVQSASAVMVLMERVNLRPLFELLPGEPLDEWAARYGPPNWDAWAARNGPHRILAVELVRETVALLYCFHQYVSGRTTERNLGSDVDQGAGARLIAAQEALGDYAGTLYEKLSRVARHVEVAELQMHDAILAIRRAGGVDRTFGALYWYYLRCARCLCLQVMEVDPALWPRELVEVASPAMGWNENDDTIECSDHIHMYAVAFTVQDLDRLYDEQITLEHTPRSVVLAIQQVCRIRSFRVQRLFAAIARAQFRRRGDKLVMELTKVEQGPWPRIYE